MHCIQYYRSVCPSGVRNYRLEVLYLSFLFVSILYLLFDLVLFRENRAERRGGTN